MTEYLGVSATCTRKNFRPYLDRTRIAGDLVVWRQRTCLSHNRCQKPFKRIQPHPLSPPPGLDIIHYFRITSCYRYRTWLLVKSWNQPFSVIVQVEKRDTKGHISHFSLGRIHFFFFLLFCFIHCAVVSISHYLLKIRSVCGLRTKKKGYTFHTHLCTMRGHV